MKEKTETRGISLWQDRKLERAKPDRTSERREEHKSFGLKGQTP